VRCVRFIFCDVAEDNECDERERRASDNDSSVFHSMALSRNSDNDARRRADRPARLRGEFGRMMARGCRENVADAKATIPRHGADAALRIMRACSMGPGGMRRSTSSRSKNRGGTFPLVARHRRRWRVEDVVLSHFATTHLWWPLAVCGAAIAIWMLIGTEVRVADDIGSLGRRR